MIYLVQRNGMEPLAIPLAKKEELKCLMKRNMEDVSEFWQERSEILGKVDRRIRYSKKGSKYD